MNIIYDYNIILFRRSARAGLITCSISTFAGVLILQVIGIYIDRHWGRNLTQCICTESFGGI